MDNNQRIATTTEKTIIETATIREKIFYIEFLSAKIRISAN